MRAPARSRLHRRASRAPVRPTATRSADTPQLEPGAHVRAVQRSIGNAATARWLGRAIQAKRTVGPAGDALEREADRVADDVVRSRGATPGRSIGRSPVTISRACAECARERRARRDDEAQRVMRASGAEPAGPPEVTAELESYLDSSAGAGRPLPAHVQAAFEPRFGRDLSSVRVHDDSRAARAAADIDATAFTTGSNVYFAAGRFRPGTREGDHLLAHELTHVVQQGAAGGLQRQIQRQFGDNPFGPPLPDLPEPDFDCSVDLAARRFQDFVNCCAKTPLGRGCSKDVIDGICKLPGVNCDPKKEPAAKCPPGFDPAGSRDFKGQCCPKGTVNENARVCCTEDRIVVNALNPRCCPDGTLPDAERKDCTTLPPPLPLCPSGQLTLKGECCFPPLVSDGLSCVLPKPPPVPPKVLPPVLEMFFRKDKPALGVNTAAGLGDSLTDQGKANFNELVKQLRDDPTVKVQLVGRASPEGSDEYNLALGQRRAEMIADALVQNGIDAARIDDPPTPELRAECKPIRPGLATCGEAGATGPGDRLVLSRPFFPAD